MSYTVLARKYRSKDFDEIVGQEQIARTLKKAIESDRIAHAYLFCGTRGTGKTSMARILAKALNCEKAKKPTTKPCGECETCLAIARGEDIDVIEIDAASNRGIDDVRKIIENARFSPARSRFKVYIIDEVHQLTKEAFNALLKVLEEPPSHVKFILATTEPERVLPTILSRCQRYDFRNIPAREIAAHLKEISKSEKVKADDDALMLVAKAGAGSMRDALSLLDRLLSIGEKSLSVEMIEQMLGLPRTQVIFDLAQSIGEGNVRDTLKRTAKLIGAGLSSDTLVASLIEHFRNLLVLKACGPDEELVEVAGFSMADLQKQAERFDQIVLSQDITLLEELRRQLRTTQAGRALLDATLVRLSLAEQFTSVDALLTGANNGAADQKKKSEVEPARVTGVSPVYRDLSTGETPVTQVALSDFVAATQASQQQDDDDDLPRPGKVFEGPSLKELLAEERAKPQPAPAVKPDGNVEPVDPANFGGVWQTLLNVLASKGPSITSILSHGQFGGIQDGQAMIRFSPGQETFAAMLDRNGKKDVVRDALCDVLSEQVGVRIEIDANIVSVEAAPARRAPVRRPNPVQVTTYVPPTPTQPTIRLTPELKESLRSTDPLIDTIITELGAEIVKVE